MPTSIQSPSRSGFSIILVLGALTILLAAIFVATERDQANSKEVTRFQDGSRSLSVVTAEMSRRERDIQVLASVGDAANFADWTSYFGHENYGVDYIGDCEVRWKIEPARTAPVADTAGNTDIPYVVNPSPDANYMPATTSDEQPNQTLYMYKVSAEARQLSGTTVISRAQGSRFVAISRQPLFRYVIFYAQRGAKGDLELSHADGVNIQGNVHSNGAIYLGSGLRVNDKIAQRGSINGSLVPSTTRIGPDVSGQPVVVTGVDGIFRLSKPLMFSILNTFPLTATTNAAAGAPVGDWTAAGSYDVASTIFPLETVVPAGATAFAKTSSGRVINPYRIKTISGSVTQGPTAVDSARLINNVAVTGSSAASGNDCRDNDRATNRKWTTVAPNDFSNHARSSANGGIQVALSGAMSNRPFEPQALTYVNADGDATTDDHEYARPSFVDATSGASSFNLPASGPAIEAPGTYLNLAMGGQGSAYMVRRTGGSGWDIRARTDLVNPAPQATQAGLIVRERPIPDTDYWPGTTGASIVDPGNPRYLPYAYGKQWYPTISPFVTADVSDDLFRDRSWDSSVLTPASVTANISLAPANRLSSYSTGGRLTLTAAANPGSNDTTAGAWSAATGYAGTDYNGTANTANSGVRRKNWFYRDPWRFVNLRKMAVDTSRTGLKLSYYTDTNLWDEYRSTGTASALPFSGVPIAITTPVDRVVASASGRVGWATAPATPSTGLWSARWSGFISPTTSSSYLFYITVSSTAHCARVWIDGKLVAERMTNPLTGSTMSSSGLTGSSSQVAGLSAGRYYPIIVEFASTSTGAPGTAPLLEWQATGSSVKSIVPDNRLFPPVTDASFSTSTFNAVYCRIDNPQATVGPAQQKIGLMARPDSVASPLLQGGGAYGMVGWSPARGFFTQRRTEANTQEQRSIGTYFIGVGTAPSGVSDPVTGNVSDNPTSSSTGWNRTATLKEVARTAASYAYTTPPPRSYTTGAVTWSVQPTIYTGDMWKDVGGGKIWTLLDGFSVGRYVGTQSWTPYIYQQYNCSITQTLQLMNSTPTFLTSDDNCTLWAFSTATATGQLTSGTMGWRASNRTFWFSGPTGTPAVSGVPLLPSVIAYNPATSIPNYLSRIYTSTANGANVMGTSVSQTNYAIGSTGSVWPTTGGVVRINKNGTISNATVADLASVTGLALVDIRTSNSIPVPTLTYPADALATGAATPAAPTLLDFTSGTGKTFGVSRANNTFTFDLRPWITGTSAFPAAAQPAYLPRNAAWPAAWTSTAAWPATMGLRPDVWRSSATAPLYTSVSNTSLLSTTSVTTPGVVTGGTGYAMIDDYKPAGWNTASEVWLGIVRSGTSLTFKAYAGTVRPSGGSDPGWVAVGNPLSIAAWGSAMLAGPCLQSGSVTTASTATFTDLRVETSQASPLDVIDAQDWDNTQGSTDDLTRYLISQYQVFFGTREITEDFFTYRDPTTSARLADEQWFYNTREFWSQPRWWDHTTSAGVRIEKDPFTSPSTTFTSTATRELLSKTTVLTLDLGAVQNYIATRTIGSAVADRIAGIGSTATVTTPSATLGSMFNGLIYTARTNRYPWNPNSNGGLPASATGTNPWSPVMSSGLLPLPNSMTVPGAVLAGYANGFALGSLSNADLLVSGIHKLQPYPLTEAPAFMPTRWHHGVRITNAANIAWNYTGGVAGTVNAQGGRTWTHASPPQFGSCRLSIVTPNQLYVQGSLNVDQHSVTYRGATTYKPTPLAIMGDQITMLSNAWNDVNYQMPGLTVTNVSGAASVAGTGILASSTYGSPASDTYYQAGIVTNNIPTTQARVREGQAAPFVDTMLFMENWDTRRMGYLGSLVVLDSRRSTQAFLLDSYKTYGTSPFGIVGTGASDPWLAYFGGASALDWIGLVQPVFSEPTRTYSFNYDFLTSEGTPPFVPFGVSSTGAGGWARIVQ